MMTKKSYESLLSFRQMLAKNIFLFFFFFIGSQQLNAQRAMYVSLAPNAGVGETWPQFLSTTANSNSLTPQAQIFLEYARDNHITYIILYGLNDLSDSNFKYNLNVFIGKAKSEYCITTVGANIFSGSIIGYPSGTNLIATYNGNNAYENKIDALVSEYEFWNNNPNKFESFFLPMLDKMNNMKANSGQPDSLEGITQVDVYLEGKLPGDANQIFANPELYNPSPVFDIDTTERNVNKVDNRADNIFLTCYKPFDNTSNFYDANLKFKTLFNLFANDNQGDGIDSTTAYKKGTRIIPLFGVYGPNTNNANYTRGYYYFDPTLSSSSTPQELEFDLFNLPANVENNNPDTTANRISKSNVAWYKYQFMPGTMYTTNEYPLYPLDTLNSIPISSILFNSNPTIACKTATFEYSGPKENGIHYTWNFGDGTAPVQGTTSTTDPLISTGTISHFFQNIGPYEVSLTLEYDYPNGCTYEYKKSITINASITDAGPDQLICNTQAIVNLSGSFSSPATNANWSGGAGTFSNIILNGTTKTASYTPTQPEKASGSVALIFTTISNAFCSTTASDTVVITFGTPSPATIDTSGSTTICVGGSVLLGANTGTGFSYLWKRGTNVVGSNSPFYTATQVGYYTVKVENAAGCSTTSTPIFIDTVTAALPSIPSISGSPTTFCVGSNVLLAVNPVSGVTYSWYKNGSAIIGANSQSYTASQSGSYTLVVTKISNGCSVNATKTVIVSQKITPTFTQLGPFCLNEATVNLPTTSLIGITGTWLLNTNSTTTVSTTTVGLSTYTFTPSAGQCANTATMTITVNPNTPLNFTAVSPICLGGTLNPLPTSNNGIVGTWSPALNNTATTTYTFTPTEGQCVSGNTMAIIVNNTPAPSANAQNRCVGQTVSSLSANGTALKWYNSATGGTVLGLGTILTNGTYYVSQTLNGCESARTLVAVTLDSPIDPIFTIATTSCLGAPLSALPLTSNNGVSGTWTPALNNSTTTEYTFSPTSVQCANIATMTITINPNITPSFNPVSAICAGAPLSLPTSSTNGINGTWSPAINNTATTTYTFTPTTGQCVTATQQQLSVTVNPLPVIILNSTAATACSTNTFNDGSASVEVSGTDTYSYLWNDNLNQTTAIATGLVAGDYSVIVTNSSSGCFATGSISVESTDALSYANGHIVAANTSETWESDQPIRLKGIIIVNGTLTIQNSSVMFGYDVIDNNDEEEPLAARFQVNDGGQLNIINSTLTGWCDEFWDGIETRGITNTANVFLDSTTIQNAKIGFTNDRRRNYLKNYVQGGYIVAENSKFLNNRLAVEIKNDASLCRFTKCEFKYNEATLFSYPAPIVCCEWEPTEMTFVHLRKGEGTLFEGNTFSVNTAVYNVLSRGTGIYSEGAKYELRPHSDNTVNLFEGLTSGIKKVNYSYGEGQLICRGSEFDNIQKGIYIQGGNSDIINNNSFVNIPDADEGGNIEASFHSYGIYINAGGSFDISSNNFSGFASTSPSAHGSHGIAFSNTGASGGLCFDNSFSGVDYGVHTQSNNLNLKIRCNVFSAEGNDHNASAFYVANGTLRPQGNSGCANDAAEAAGNTWLGPNASLGKSIESYAVLPFDYFANPADAFFSQTPYPTNHIGTVSVNPSVICANIPAGINTCLDPLLGISPTVNGSWFTNIKNKIFELHLQLGNLKNQFLELQNIQDTVYNDYLQILSRDIEWLMNEIQLLENQLYKGYLIYDQLGELENMLVNSLSSESKKMLSEFYLNSYDYLQCRNTIDSIIPVTKREVQYLNPESADIRLRENEAFVKFMYTNLDIAESGQTIMTAAAAAIDSLQDVADKGVKISVRAGEAVGQRTNIFAEYPIVKNHGGEKSMKINNSNSPLGKIQFDVYPVPTTSILTVNYIIPGNATNAKIEIFDLTGKLIQAKLILQKEEYSIQFDLSGVETGIYTCIYKIDGKQISAKKIAVVK
jgi:hypothetical protein